MCFRENKIDLVGGLCDGEAMKLADHCHSVTAERWVREGGGGKGLMSFPSVGYLRYRRRWLQMDPCSIAIVGLLEMTLENKI